MLTMCVQAYLYLKDMTLVKVKAYPWITDKNCVALPNSSLLVIS